MPDGESAAPPAARSFEAFYRDRWAELRRAVGAATFLGIDPDDIVQDTMLVAHEHYERFPSDDQLLLWCKRVGLNLVHARTHTAYGRHESPDPSPLDAANAGVDLHAVDAAEQATENADLARVMAMLEPRHAEVLLLDAAGHNHAEMATILRMTPDATRKLLQRAREAARAAWGKLVAACFFVAVRLRRGRHGTSGQEHQLLASAAAMALAVATIVPNVGPTADATPAVRPPARVVASPTHLIDRTAPVAKPAAVPTAVHTASGGGVVGSAHLTPPKAPSLVPTVKKCTVRVCIATGCANKNQAGDVVYLKPAGEECDVNVTESVAPVCPYVVTNPVVGCRRQGAPPYLINPPPPPSPQGEPL